MWMHEHHLGRNPGLFPNQENKTLWSNFLWTEQKIVILLRNMMLTWKINKACDFKMDPSRLFPYSQPPKSAWKILEHRQKKPNLVRTTNFKNRKIKVNREGGRNVNKVYVQLPSHCTFPGRSLFPHNIITCGQWTLPTHL